MAIPNARMLARLIWGRWTSDGVVVLIYGKSGSGKTRSLKNFAEDEILLVNVEGKPLPFRKKFKYTMQSDDISQIVSQIAKMPCKTAVIDDAGYIMTHLFMAQHRNKKGNASFEMYDDIADAMYNLISGLKNWRGIADDKIIYIMFHEDTDDFGNTKFKTFGKLIDNKICMEGMVTMCIRCMSDEGKHFFRVKTDGSDITKTPEDMFDTAEIDNDLKLVDTTIRNFYGMNDTETEDKNEQTE